MDLFVGTLLLLGWPFVVMGLYRWKEPGLRARPTLTDAERRRMHRRCAEE